MAWYDDIEDEIIAREEWAERSTTIGQFDQWVHKLELQALAYKTKNDFQPQIYAKTVQDVYFTETGEKRTVNTRINTQNIKWINDYIQKTLARSGCKVSYAEIRAVLDDVSMAYMAADMQRTTITVRLSETLKHRIRLEKLA